MNAIEMLKGQHREVEQLFKELDKARGAARGKIFEKIADALAVHAAIEERHFYPAMKANATEEMLLECAEEHLAIKRVIADLLAIEAKDETFVAKAKVLRDEIEHHVEEEETQLFPKVEKIFPEEVLEALAEEMAESQEELLEAGNPREAVPGETAHAAHI